MQGVHDDVGAAKLELHCEVEAEQFADPMVLWDRCQPLIQQKLEDVLTWYAAPKTWAPMANRVDQPNQLALIYG
jgi:hypothetical protein